MLFRRLRLKFNNIKYLKKNATKKYNTTKHQNKQHTNNNKKAHEKNTSPKSECGKNFIRMPPVGFELVRI